MIFVSFAQKIQCIKTDITYTHSSDLPCFFPKSMLQYFLSFVLKSKYMEDYL